MTEAATTLLDAMADPALLGTAFQGESWDTWRAVLRAAFALPMTDREVETFRTLAERDPPTRPVRELVVIAGRRGGKDSIASAIAAHAAAFRDYHAILRPGERALIPCLACDREQAGIVLGFTRAYFASGPLASLVETDTTDGIELSTGASIAISTNSFRAVRGRTIPLAIFDEVAYWRDEASATPDKETYRAITPGLATVPGAMLVLISSPYRRSGLLYEKWRKHFGKPGDVLVIVAPSRTLNPTLDEQMIAEALEDDPAAAAAEWLAQFRSDIETFISREAVDAAVVPGRHELPRVSGAYYVGFADPAGGSGGDSFAIGIAHQDHATGRTILDLARERRPPFSPEQTVADFAGCFKAYGVKRIRLDRWGGEFPPEQFRKHGVQCEPSEKVKSDIYRDFLPLINSGRVELLDHPRLAAQLCQLERRTARGGHDSIDHPPGAHDDLANAAAGAIVEAATKKGGMYVPSADRLNYLRGLDAANRRANGQDQAPYYGTPISL